MTSLEEINDYYCPECGAPKSRHEELCVDVVDFDFEKEALYVGMACAEYRLNPNSCGYNPRYDFKKHAEKMFVYPHNVEIFLKGVEEYQKNGTFSPPDDEDCQEGEQ